jgi:hypothetical protein
MSKCRSLWKHALLVSKSAQHMFLIFPTWEYEGLSSLNKQLDNIRRQCNETVALREPVSAFEILDELGHWMEKLRKQNQRISCRLGTEIEQISENRKYGQFTHMRPSSSRMLRLPRRMLRWVLRLVASIWMDESLCLLWAEHWTLKLFRSQKKNVDVNKIKIDKLMNYLL